MNPFHSGTLAISKDPDEMPHMVAFHQSMHCLLRYKSSGTEIHHFIEILTDNPLKYKKMDNPILSLVVSMCIG